MIKTSELKSSSLFRYLSDEELSRICSIAQSKDFPKGSLVIKQDDPSDYFYVIQKGSVKMFRTLQYGSEMEVARLGVGNFFGEMAILDGSKRSVSVKTLEDSTLLMISRVDFLNEVWKMPAVVAKLLRDLSSRVRSTDEKFITELSERNAALQKLIEEIKKAEQSKSKFFALASHELRTPLGVMLMALSVLEEENKKLRSKKQKSLVDMIQKQALKLSDTIASILKASDSVDGSLEKGKSEEDVNVIILGAISDLDQFAKARKLKLSSELDSALPAVTVDSSKFYQIIVNLLMNAIRFTPDGGTVKIETKKNGSAFTLSVSDTGIGIEKHHLKEVFKPFYVVENELNHSSGTYEFMSGGLGLGLTIVKKFVEFHNGVIQITSEKDRGTQVHVTIPLKQPLTKTG